MSGGSTVDSGSPFVKNGDNTVMGVATNAPGGLLNFNPVYNGLNAMNTYFVAHTGTGAWLCQTSTC